MSYSLDGDIKLEEIIILSDCDKQSPSIEKNLSSNSSCIVKLGSHLIPEIKAFSNCFNFLLLIGFCFTLGIFLFFVACLTRIFNLL